MTCSCVQIQQGALKSECLLKWFHCSCTCRLGAQHKLIFMVVEGYNGFHARFSKFTGEIFGCDCNVQLSTAIQLFNSDSVFQRSTAIATFNRDSVFQRSTAIATFNRDSTFNAQLRLQLPTAIPTFNRDSNFQPRFRLSTAISCMLYVINTIKEPRARSKFIN